jgi:PTH1 family peptidyl-tRNA hydrolase
VGSVDPSPVGAHLGGKDFTRIKIGIGRPPLDEGSAEYKEAEVVAYVLIDVTAEEKQIVSQAIPRVSEAIYCLLTEGLTAAMNKYD